VRARLLATIGLLAFAPGVGALAAVRQAKPAFPHARHERVFPVCEGCHGGVVSGDANTMYPRPTDCARCHDGTRQARVEWAGPRPRVSNLHFSHVEHRRATEGTGEAATCQACHATAGPPGRMAVAGPNPSRCLQCHAHASDRHMAPTAECSRCHLPITRAVEVDVERVARFPRPPWHDSATFASEHGRMGAVRTGSCAVCHARESCQRCHANADSVPLIMALGRDARIASLVRGRPAEYRAPASHGAEWPVTHGAPARERVAACANCHVRSNCASCHLESGGASGVVIRNLPPAKGGRLGPGVPASSMTRAVHPKDIATRHARLASTGSLDCTQCHSTQTCSACHAGADSRAFHAPNFAERHAVEVFSASGDCQSCHNTERFCRACHSSSGVAAGSRMSAAFHTGQPMWVLSHGQAARMGMESCASCHRQNDCVRCHSAAAGWGVNPHGRGFPANALAARNRSSCGWCHLSSPVGGS
jgi:hypothetical protein